MLSSAKRNSRKVLIIMEFKYNNIKNLLKNSLMAFWQVLASMTMFRNNAQHWCVVLLQSDFHNFIYHNIFGTVTMILERLQNVTDWSMLTTGYIKAEYLDIKIIPKINKILVAVSWSWWIFFQVLLFFSRVEISKASSITENFFLKTRTHLAGDAPKN